MHRGAAPPAGSGIHIDTGIHLVPIQKRDKKIVFNRKLGIISRIRLNPTEHEQNSNSKSLGTADTLECEESRLFHNITFPHIGVSIVKSLSKFRFYRSVLTQK